MGRRRAALDRLETPGAEGRVVKTAGEIAFDKAMESFAEEKRRHLRRLRTIRLQGYAVQALIVGAVLLFIIGPLFL